MSENIHLCWCFWICIKYILNSFKIFQENANKMPQMPKNEGLINDP